MSSPIYQKLIQRQTSSHKLSNFGQNKIGIFDSTPRNQMMQLPSHFKPQSSSRIIRIERALTSGDASPHTPQTSQKSVNSPHLKSILEKTINMLQTMRGINPDEPTKSKIELVIHQMSELCGLKQTVKDEMWEKLYQQIREEKQQKQKAQTQLNQLIDRQRATIKSLLMTYKIQFTYQMRKRPSSPYTFLVEFNKRTQIEDGKYKTEYPMYWSQQFQQLTPFKIPKRFEQLHCQRIGVDSISELPQTIQKQEVTVKKEIKLMPKFQQPKRNQFSMSKFQMQQIQRFAQDHLIERITL